MRTLIAAAVYAFSLLAQWNAVGLGFVDPDAAAWLAAFIVVGVCGFLVAIRSGLTQRFADPALAAPQMVFGIVSIAFAYHINPQVRGVLPMLAGLVIMFGAFSLTPQRCRGVGWFAVAAFAATIVYGVWREPTKFVPLIEAHHFVFVAAVLLTMAFLAGEFSKLRANWRRQKRELQAAMDLLDAGQRAMAQAKGVAEAASLAKTRFLANMSHELRTPLSAVIGAAQLLRAERSDAEQQVYLADAIERSGSNLLGLIENILDISRIEAGEMRLRTADFHLGECVEAGLASAALAAQAKGLRLTCYIGPELKVWRNGDADRLRQIVINLLGNAVKFTLQGEVALRVLPGTVPDGVHISVTDTGVGIDAAALPKIFEPFHQANDGADRRFGGSGLGLAIVQQLVETMGGQIGVRSEVGRGSCFEFEIGLPTAGSCPDEPEPWAYRVAIHEPHDASAMALQAHLLRLGCEVRRCDDAIQLRQWLGDAGHAQQTWMLLAADAPKCESLLDAAADLTAPAHVIVISDRVTHEDETARAAMQLPRHLIRPVTRAALVSRMGVERSTEPGALQVSHELLTTTELQDLTHVLVVEDDELNRKIVGRLLQHAGHRVSAAADGKQALQAFAQLDRVDLVLMDWQMPDMDGLEVTRRLRAGAAGAAGCNVPIVALTANAFAEDREACLAAGMNDFLSKPVQATGLMSMVERWTRRSAAVPRAVAPVERAVRSARPPPYDPSVLAALPMVADGSEPEYARELLAMFLDAQAPTLNDIDRALASNQVDELQRLVHTLKSTSAGIGAPELGSLAASCEARLRRGEPPPAELVSLLAAAFARL
ncbi:MAG: ATP-binding protein, partial [Rhizobacter sp.]|nr:ATP-binding protein [Rhizobacter sp.]